MSTIYELAKTFRSQLLKREAKASSEILAAFQGVLKNLSPKIEALQEETKNNPQITIAQVFLLERYKELENQTKTEIARFSLNAAGITSSAQRANAFTAFQEASELIKTGIDAFVRLPTRTIETFAGLASDGSPLQEIFADIADGAVKGVKDKLSQGIALGQNPRKIAREIRQSFGTPAARALTISRTESLRAYREASRTVYQENKNIVKGYIWLSARSRRTCAMCFAMDGTKHDVDKPFGTHVNCRCTMLPDLGKSLPKTGAQIFDSLDAETQKDILGRGKFELYSQGKIQLSDLVAESNSKKWGKVRTEKALKDL